MKCCLTLVLVSLFTSFSAIADVYHCTRDGRAVYQDKPCVGTQSKKVEIYVQPSAKQKEAAKTEALSRAEARKHQARIEKLLEDKTLAKNMSKQQALQAWGEPCEKVLQGDGVEEVEEWVYCQFLPVHRVDFKGGKVVDVRQ